MEPRPIYSYNLSPGRHRELELPRQPYHCQGQKGHHPKWPFKPKEYDKDIIEAKSDESFPEYLAE